MPSLCVCPIDKINVIRSGVGWTWWQRPRGIFGGSRQTDTQNSDAKEIFRTRICVAMEKWKVSEQFYTFFLPAQNIYGKILQEEDPQDVRKIS